MLPVVAGLPHSRTGAPQSASPDAVLPSTSTVHAASRRAAAGRGALAPPGWNGYWMDGFALIRARLADSRPAATDAAARGTAGLRRGTAVLGDARWAGMWAGVWAFFSWAEIEVTGLRRGGDEGKRPRWPNVIFLSFSFFFLSFSLKYLVWGCA